MMSIKLKAEVRKDVGKGASRRLRKDNKVPSVIYGGTADVKMVNFYHNQLIKALEDERIYSSVFDVELDDKTIEHVILKALQRHPYKPVILHMDLQRVSAKDVLVKNVPLHFLNEDIAKGVKAGGKINHAMTQVEIRCQARHLPEFIAVDLANLELNQILHLSDLKLPKDVALTADLEDNHHNLPVVSIHVPSAGLQEEETTEAQEENPSEETSIEPDHNTSTDTSGQ